MTAATLLTRAPLPIAFLLFRRQFVQDLRARKHLMTTALTRRFEAAKSLAGEAGALALRLRPAPGAASVSLKGAQDWLTEADTAVERYLAERLAAAFPEDGFQGEETGRGREGALRWVVDPIDGTSNYAHGGARWCISIGLVEERRALLGVIEAPALGERFAACQGLGTTLNGAAIRAAGTAALARGIVECGWLPRRPTPDYLALCARVMAAGAMLRAGGSGALGLADVAAGRLDGYVELHINLWDVAAGLAILAEAGAVVSTFLPAGTVAGAPILAAAPGVADALARAADIEDAASTPPFG